MIREIIKDKDKLTFRCKEFDVLADNQKKSIQLTQDLGDTLQEQHDMLWLAANQIGDEERAFAMKMMKDEIDIFMNPAFLERAKPLIFREKDPIDGKEYFVPRYSEVSIGFQDTIGQNKGVKFNGPGSIIVCQAMDMIDGITVSDYGREVPPEFDTATDDEKADFIMSYADEVNEAMKMLDKDLSSDEETKDTWNAFKFIKSVGSGETELEKPELSNRKKKKLKQLLKRFGVKEKK